MLRVHIAVRTGLVTTVLSTFLLGMAFGQDTPKTGKNTVDAGTAQSQQKSPSADAVSQLGVAYSLVDIGRTSKSPLALLTAAEILHKVAASDLAEKPTSEVGKGEKPANVPAKQERPDITVAGLIAEAKVLAGSDTTLLAVVQKVSEKCDEKSRGAVGGPKRQVTNVAAHATDVYKITFRGNEPAVIVVSGDGTTDLDLYVYDENGNLIASDDDASDDCIVRFTPLWTGTFIVRVVNRGWIYNRYVIVTN